VYYIIRVHKYKLIFNIIYLKFLLHIVVLILNILRLQYCKFLTDSLNDSIHINIISQFIHRYRSFLNVSRNIVSRITMETVQSTVRIYNIINI